MQILVNLIWIAFGSIANQVEAKTLLRTIVP